MSQDNVEKSIEQAASLISHASYVVAFTGAGVSTDSGIPDYRSAESGIWNDVDQLRIASIHGFKQDPSAFYHWVRPLTDTILKAQPNPAHHALVQLENAGLLKAIITQNIDMLHTRAGNTLVYELHGHMRTGTCIHCFQKYDGKKMLHAYLETGEIPRCTQCSKGVIKPDVILFGEQLPIRVFQSAQEATRQSDLMIIIGSSLEVAPASDIPVLAARTGAKIVIINLEPTPADSMADVVIHARAADILPRIVSQVEKISSSQAS